jgi:very-short-patch-repair endonuclease
MNRAHLPPDDAPERGSEEIYGPVALTRLGENFPPILERLALALFMKPKCESPIEVMLGVELAQLLQDGRFELRPQYQWRWFRIDFAILKDKKPVAFIECDGKAFHSTSKQIANDHSKDYHAGVAGIRMFRFTGSEINRNANYCAALVVNEIGQ